MNAVRAVAAGAGVCALAALGALAEAGAQPYTPFSHFERLGGDGLATAQVRVAPLAQAERPLPGLLLTVAGGDPDTTALEDNPRPLFPLAPGSARAARGAISAAAMQDVLARLARFPAATRGIVDSMGVFALTLVAGRGDSVRVYETTLAPDVAGPLLRAFAAAVESTPEVSAALASLACATEVTNGAPPGDVTAEVRVTLDRFVFDAATRELTCRLRVVNRSASPLAAPLDVVVRAVPASVRLLAPDGRTCRVFGWGVPSVRMSLAGALAPGAAVERPLRLSNPEQRNVRFEFRVYSGEADR